MEVIQARELFFDYGDVPILEQVDFAVQKGDFVSLIGQNGSGKSTLVRLILGELSPKKGRMLVMGRPPAKAGGRLGIGYVPQSVGAGGAFPATAQEVVRAHLYPRVGLMRFLKKEHKQMADEALESVGMGAFSRRLVGTLSGGQRQRVMMAAALVNRPDILILDEPTAGVDAAAAEAIYELLQDLNRKGITILMVTHDTERVAKVATRIFCVEEASLVELDRPQLQHELSHRHRHPGRGKEARG